MPVAVVTDSTADLPSELTEGYGIHVVPLYVVLPGRSGREGLDVGPQDVARALAVRGQTVSTSRPTPGDFVAVYRAALDAGASAFLPKPVVPLEFVSTVRALLGSRALTRPSRETGS